MMGPNKHEITTNVSCENVRESFSDYLDGAVSGVEMAALSSHMDDCSACATDFRDLRNVQSALGKIGPAIAPARLQARLRAAIADEAARGSHLPWNRRLLAAWDRTLAPLAFRAASAVAIAMLLVGGLGWMFATPIAVQANDDGLADLRSPRYLYSQVDPLPLNMSADVPVVIEARVNASGRVYDFAVLEGKLDPVVQQQLSQNLLASVFRPASVFGVPVPGRVVLTFTGVSVHS